MSVTPWSTILTPGRAFTGVAAELGRALLAGAASDRLPPLEQTQADIKARQRQKLGVMRRPQSSGAFWEMEGLASRTRLACFVD